MIKSIFRILTPRPLWQRLRAWKIERMITTFRPYEAEHDYAGIPLKVRIPDPLARGWYDHKWETLLEVELLRSARLVPGARVFDVGAHQGVVAMILAHHVGPGGEVVAVEALPHNAVACETNRDLNDMPQIRVITAAISDRLGKIDIAKDFNSHVACSKTMTTTIPVDSITIDWLTDNFGKPDVLFLDVEGHELKALRGASRTLDLYPDCYVEIHRGCGLESAGGTVANVLAYFSPDRYELHVWSDGEPDARRLNDPADCPKGGRIYLVAICRDR